MMLPSYILDLCSVVNYPVVKKHHFKKDDSEDWLYERDDVLGISITIKNKKYTIDTLSRDILNVHNIDNILITNNITYYLNNKQTCRFLPAFIKIVYPNKTIVRTVESTIPFLKVNNYASFYSHINEIQTQYNVYGILPYFKNFFCKTDKIINAEYLDLTKIELYYHETDMLNLIPVYSPNVITENSYNNVPSYLSNTVFSLYDVEKLTDIHALYEDIYINKTNKIELICLRKTIEQLFSDEDVFKNINTYEEMIMLLKGV